VPKKSPDRVRPPRTLYLIKRLQAHTYVHLEAVLAPMDLTAGEYTVLSVLAHRDLLSSAQLARRFSVKPQSMIKLVASLESKQLISRAEAADNRRVLRVSLTNAGRRRLAECDRAVDRLEADLFAGLSVTELAGLRDLLGRLLESSVV
jgi:DNA-binding MarR family transcriptional regulator